MALFQIWKLLADKYLLFIMTYFLLKIGPKASLQLRKVLFSDGWWVIGTGVLNYDTFSHHEELQNSRKSFYRKCILKWFLILVTKNHWKYNLTQQTTKYVVLLVWLHSLVVPDRRTTVNVEPCEVFSGGIWEPTTILTGG